ncbi:L,D-transpeptidase [Anaerosacchariphilus polymeriproducens]|uniref:L,D-transpeptidase n=1 Tax=Anaerosacchariphilus polymeriproducens TaxID=1812858 RepID=A0A371ARB7_9FIRM|nr:L,D-transpeptidase [Anaerosacchariphilus polymeriproducens]RDU22127.1 L,D-transpeptidase [Anaerosacchariphilus polymeriproducens]
MNNVMTKTKKAFLALTVLIFAAVLAPITISMGKSYASAYSIRVNKATNVVTIYNSSGAAVKAMICSTGEATPIGTFRIQEKYRWHELMGPCWGQYCSRYRPGMLFHSVYYWTNGDPSSLDYDAWDKLGTTASHGCIRLTTADAKWLYDNCSYGTTVSIFYGSSADDPLGKPVVIKVSQGAWNGWDPTDPNSSNPWHAARPSIKVRNTKIQYGSNFNPTSTITAYDSAGNDVTSTVSISGANKVKTKKLGKKFKVTYSVTDALGRTASKVVTYKIVDLKKPIIKGFSTKKKNREYNSLFYYKKKVSAKSYAGKNLNKKLLVYVKMPHSSKYIKLRGKAIYLNKLGTYTFKYKVKNPKNKKTAVKYRKIKVNDNKKPQIFGMTSTRTVNYKTTINLKSGLYAKLRSGKKFRSSIILKINTPNGNKGTYKYSKIKTAFTFNQLGKYKFTYIAKNPRSGKTLTCYRYVTVVDPVTITANNVTSGLDLYNPNTNTIQPINYNVLSLATASGLKSGNLTGLIKITSVKNPLNQNVAVSNGLVTLDKAGIYTVTYQVSGTNLRTATKTITIKVINSKVGSTNVPNNKQTDDTQTPDTGSNQTPDIENAQTQDNVSIQSSDTN